MQAHMVVHTMPHGPPAVEQRIQNVLVTFLSLQPLSHTQALPLYMCKRQSLPSHGATPPTLPSSPAPGRPKQ